MLKKGTRKGGQIDYHSILVGKVGKNEVTFYTKNALFWTKKVLGGYVFYIGGVVMPQYRV